MSLVKIQRLRKTISTTDITKTISGGDIKLEIYLETKTENGTPPISYEEWELKFITLDLPADVPLTKKYSNKDSQYGANQNEVLDFIVPDFIQLATLTKLRALSYTVAEADELSKSYYGLIQDPFSEQAPLTRNYGTDGYFLNNGTEVLVRWNTGASVSFWDTNYVEAEITGINYSLADGSEGWDQSLSLPGSTPSVPFIQTPEDIEFAKAEKKKIFKYVFAYNGTQSYMLSSGQIKLYEKPNEPDFFPGEVKDLDLVTKLVDLWKTKVPNYDLKISNPNYQAGGSLEFKDPLQGLSPSTAVADNTGSSVSTADEVKFELSIVYDKNVVIKADQDLPKIEIYVGEPPTAGEFLFDGDEFDDLALLDEEYREVEFGGDGESLQTIEELREIEYQIKKDIENGDALPPPSGNESLGGGETLPQTFTNLANLPAKSSGGTGANLTFPLEFNGVPYYAQFDTRWSTIKYSNLKGGAICKESNGSESTIRSSGCGITSVAMIINYWAKKGKTKGGIFTTPPEIADIFARNGGRVCGKGSSMYAPAVWAAIKQKFGLSQKSVSEGQMTTALRAGYPVVIGGQRYTGFKTPSGSTRNSTTDGHFMVATGIDSGGYLRVNDPGYAVSGAIAAFPNGKVTGGENTPRGLTLIYPSNERSPV